VEKYGKAGQDTHIRRRKGVICMPDNKGKNTDTFTTLNTY